MAIACSSDSNPLEPVAASALPGEPTTAESTEPDTAQLNPPEVPASEVPSSPESPESLESPESPEQGAALPAPAVVEFAACDAAPDTMRVRMLDLINAARAVSRQCGTEQFDAAGALSWDTRLAEAATSHSNDMALHNFFSHTGSDGQGVGERTRAAGFAWRSVGENIAAGQTSAAAAVEGWLNSPGHCRNIMGSRFTAVAVACVQAQDSAYKRYWTQVLASP